MTLGHWPLLGEFEMKWGFIEVPEVGGKVCFLFHGFLAPMMLDLH